MSNIRINYGAIISDSSRCDNAMINITSAASTVNSNANCVDNSIKCRSNIANRLRNITNNIYDINNRVWSIKDVSIRGANTYKNVDYQEKRKASSISTSNVGNFSKMEKLFK